MTATYEYRVKGNQELEKYDENQALAIYDTNFIQVYGAENELQRQINLKKNNSSGFPKTANTRDDWPA